MYDPFFQTHSILGAYPGLTSPFQTPYTSLNPLTALSPLTAAYSPTVIPPPLQQLQQLQQLQLQQQQQQQLAQILAARATIPQLLAASPWIAGVSQPLIASSVLQNPLIGAGLESPFVNPLLLQTALGVQPYPFSPYIGQTIPQPFATVASPYGHSQINPMLAPQSWVGQPGLQANHGIHPALVSQVLGRGFHGVPGMLPTL